MWIGQNRSKRQCKVKKPVDFLPNMLFLCNFTTRKQKVIIKERNEAYISFVCIFIGRLDLLP